MNVLIFGCTGSSLLPLGYSWLRCPGFPMASPVAKHALWGAWNLPRPGVETVSPAVEGCFLTTEPAGKSWVYFEGLAAMNLWMGCERKSRSETDPFILPFVSYVSLGELLNLPNLSASTWGRKALSYPVLAYIWIFDVLEYVRVQCTQNFI